MLKAEERTYIPYKVCASYGSSIFLKGNSKVFADDPSEEGFPSGRNAYPVTEKIEELKKEEKNDMEKKKTFQEYTKEALYEIEKTEAALKQAKLEKEQAEHRIQRSLNYLDTQKKKNERHELIC